jgi:holo-[acyl-carrier protein] synthase
VIVGIGLDVVETARIAHALGQHGRRFQERVFTAAELRECGERRDQAVTLASRFAAKEACLKALGTGWTRGISFLQVEVLSDDHGRPRLQLLGKAAARAADLGVRRMHVTLTHEPGIAAAVVILEGEESTGD